MYFFFLMILVRKVKILIRTALVTYLWRDAQADGLNNWRGIDVVETHKELLSPPFSRSFLSIEFGESLEWNWMSCSSRNSACGIHVTSKITGPMTICALTKEADACSVLWFKTQVLAYRFYDTKVI